MSEKDVLESHHRAALIAFLQTMIEGLAAGPLPFDLPSNHWQHSTAGAIPGVFQPKDPISYLVKSSFGYSLRLWYFPTAGGIIPAHTHHYPHDSIIAHGTVSVTGDREGRNGIPMTMHDVAFFDAEVEHSIRAITDGAMIIHTYPIHIEDPDGN